MGCGSTACTKPVYCPSFQRRQRVELRPRPEALRPGSRPAIQSPGRSPASRRTPHAICSYSDRKAAPGWCGSPPPSADRPLRPAGRPAPPARLCNGCRSSSSASGREYQPAVARLCHTKMFQFHFMVPPLSRQCEQSAPAMPRRCTAYSASAPSTDLIALHIHFLRGFRVVVQGHGTLPSAKSLLRGGFRVLQPVAAACGGKGQHIGTCRPGSALCQSMRACDFFAVACRDCAAASTLRSAM